MEELFYAFQTLHLSGLKMLPVYAGFDPRDKRCDPVYQYCQKNSLPILFHSGTTYNHEAVLGYSRPWLF
jgi:predicted TIM-barrel fold metal-dependent hydrolase